MTNGRMPGNIKNALKNFAASTGAVGPDDIAAFEEAWPGLAPEKKKTAEDLLLRIGAAISSGSDPDGLDGAVASLAGLVRRPAEKPANDPLPVFILTRTGVGFNDEGIQAVRDLVLDDDTSGAGPQGYGVTDRTTGILALTGAHLLKPDVLAESLKENPTARVVLSKNQNGDMCLCPYGPDGKGLPAVIRVLETAETDSWTALMSATGNLED